MTIPQRKDPLKANMKGQNDLVYHVVLHYFRPIAYARIRRLLEEAIMEEKSRKRQAISKIQQVAVFRRDGWLCRWCRKPVIFAPAMKFIERELRQSGYAGNLAYFHLRWTRKDSPLLDELGAVIDHVDAFSTGGSSEIGNLVTACNKCNAQKSAATSSNWEERRPHKFVKGKFGEPVDWDGLSTLFMILARRDVKNLTVSEQQWLAALDAAVNSTSI